MMKEPVFKEGDSVKVKQGHSSGSHQNCQTVAGQIGTVNDAMMASLPTSIDTGFGNLPSLSFFTYFVHIGDQTHRLDEDCLEPVA